MQRLKPRYPKLNRSIGLARGLVAAYPLFEGSGSFVADFGGRNNRASLTATSWISSPFGSALSFNGSTSTLQSGATFPTIDNGDFTVVVQFCPTAMPATYIALFDNAGRDPSAFFNAGGGAATWYLAYGAQATDSVGSITIAVNNRYRFIWTHAGSTNTVYINGKVSGTSSGAVSIPAAAVVQIGLNPSGGGQKFTGYVDEVRTYNRALSASEVAQDYFDPFAIYRPRSRYLVGVAGAATSYLFPTKAWVWNKNTLSVNTTNVEVSKGWVWNHQATSANLSIATVSKSWVWNKNNLSLASAIVSTQKAVVWAKNTFQVQKSISFSNKSWQWLGQNVTWPFAGTIKRLLMLLGFGS